MSLSKFFKDNQKLTVENFEKLVDSIEFEDNFKLDEIRFSKKEKNCVWKRKTYKRHGKKYVKYVKVCEK